MRLLAIMLLLLGMIPIAGQSQQTVGGEFFFNTYKDFGKGTPFTLTSDQTQLELDVSSVDEGLNILYLRTKNNLGQWSLTSKTPFYRHTNRSSVETVEMEYFFDSYGDFGKGRKMPLVAGQSDYLIDLEGLSSGLHLLYLRTKNTLGQWSHTTVTAFYMTRGELAKIVELRYQFVATGFESEMFSFTEFEPTTDLVLEQNMFMANASGLEEGKTYRIKIFAVNEKGQQSFIFSTQFQYSIKPSLMITQVTATDTNCFGSSDGKVVVEATSEGLEMEYSLDNITYQALPEFENLAAGDYKVYVRDKNDITNVVEAPVTVTSPTQINLSFSANTRPSCVGNADGGFTANATGGTGAFTYKLSTQSTFQSSNQFTGLAAGDYIVVAKDEKGCEREASVSILPPTDISISFTGLVQPACPSDANGGFTVNATGGAGGFTYKLPAQPNFQTAAQFTALPAGTYTVTVKDANGCEKTAEVVLAATSVAPPKPTISIQGTDGISAEVSLSSSSASGNQWLRNGVEIAGATGTTLAITQPGNYQVRVSNGTCSTISDATTITDLAEIRQGAGIKLIPNPAQDATRLKFEREFFLERVSIVNGQGVLLRTIDIQRMTDEVVIQVSSLPTGSYILVVEGVGMNERIKLIKQ